MKYKSIIIKDVSDSFIKEWEVLWKTAQNASLFNSYEWFVVWSKTYKVTEFELYACYEKDRLVAVLPLCKGKQFGIKVNTSLNNNFLVDTAFLVEKYDKVLFKIFFEKIMKEQSFYITKVDNDAAKILRELFPRMLIPLMSVNPYLDPGDDPLRFTSKSTRKNLRKVTKNNEGKLHFTMYGQEEQLRDHLKTMFKIEQKSSKKLKSMDIFSKKENKDFFTNLVNYAGKFIQIGFLYYEQLPVVYQFAFVYKDVFEAYQTSYLYEYRSIDPGKTMLSFLLESLKGKGVTRFDLGGGISSYKQEFTPDYYFLYDIYFSNNPVYMTWWRMINFARRKKQVLFPLKHTRDHEFLFKTL